MKVSTAAKSLFRQALRDSDVSLSLSDTEVDGLIRHVRTSLGKTVAQSVEDEQRVLTVALVPLRLKLEKTGSADQDEQWWSTILWNLFAASVNNTQGAEKVPQHAGSEELWADMITVVLNTEVQETTRPQFVTPWFGSKLFVGFLSVLCGIMVCYSASWVSMGRSKLWLVLIGLSLFFAGVLWCRFGFPLFSKLKQGMSDGSFPKPVEADRLSLKSRASSQRLKAENDRLKALLDEATARAQQQSGKQSLEQLGIATGDHGLMASLEAMSGVPAPATQTQVLPEKGSVVIWTDSASSMGTANMKGVIFAIANRAASVKFLDGSFHHGIDVTSLKAFALREEDVDHSALLKMVFEALGMSTGPVQPHVSGAARPYAPLEVGVGIKVMGQAKRVKDSLVLWSSKSALMPHWPKLFWAEVGKLEPLEGIIRGVLLAHGYLGDGIGVLPRVQDLQKKLEELEAQGAPSHSTALFKIQEGMIDPELDEGHGMESWENALSAELKRAAPEIYLSIRGAGVRNTRDWVNSMFAADKRTGPQYLELFNCATLVDFEISKAKTGNQSEVLKVLAPSDVAEVNLRRLAAWVHESRTGDKAAATAMLAVKPSSMDVDIGPHWLVTEAATYSQSEHKRRERAKAQQGGGGKGKSQHGKGDGKGKGKKQKEGSGGAQKHTQG